ncbi:MAG TPA: alkaline phosphatase D family protein [Ramlibacter sp.]|nr:alkaline phosphatase D family protein [Ramlibacter sp.]
MKSTWHRREILRLALASAGAGWLPRSSWAQPRFTSNPFALGVASGSPLADSVVLWTRLVGDLPASAITVQWEVADDDRFTRVVQRGQQQAMPELAHSVHAEVSGLAPDRWYFYRFMVGDATSATGRTRTMPAPGASPSRLRLSYASCQRWDHGYFNSYRHMLKEDLDFVFFLGDYIYEYANSANSVRVPTRGTVLTLDDYRARYALHRSEADLQAMHAACPWIVTWDDHEVQNDYAGLTAGSGTQVADFAARRAAAYQAYYEHMPLRAQALSQTRLYSEQRFGKLANIVILDDRQYRDAQVCNPNGRLGSSTLDRRSCDVWDDPKRTLLGAAQEQWLDGVLAKGDATWTIFGQQTLFGERNFRPAPDRVLWNDGWDGYSAARKRFTDSLQRHKAPNPVLLGGDVHENWVGHVKADYAKPDSAAIGIELCGTSITSRSSSYDVNAALAANPHFIFADQRKGYGVVEFTPAGLSAKLRAVEDVTKPETRIETLASFVAGAGRPRIERA